MIFYHGTPIGGSRQDAARFLQAKHALVPFFRQDDMAVVAEVCQSFILDNSAYSIWKTGGDMDYSGYIEWVEKWHKHPGFDWAIIPDDIKGDHYLNDELAAMWPMHIKGVPVYHLHDPFDRLVRLSKEYERVAIGGSEVYPNLNSPAWQMRMHDLFDYICDNDGVPPCKLHGLRMLNPDVFKRFPLSSADSCNAGRNNHKSKYPQPTAAQRATFIANQIEAHNSAPVWTRSSQIKIF
jgi:hypothetical protein